MLKYIKSLVELPELCSLRERVNIGVTISGLPECIVTSVQLSVANGSTTSDVALRIPDGIPITEMRNTVQVANPSLLPTLAVTADGNPLFTHHITYLAKSIAFGAETYSARGISDEIYLHQLGTIDFNNPPLDLYWSAQQMITHIISASGAPLAPVFYFEDFEVLHITDFYRVPYVDMINDVLSGLPISITYSAGGIMNFVDTIHKSRLTHSITGNAVTSLSASITYIPPVDKEW